MSLLKRSYAPIPTAQYCQYKDTQSVTNIISLHNYMYINFIRKLSSENFKDLIHVLTFFANK